MRRVHLELSIEIGRRDSIPHCHRKSASWRRNCQGLKSLRYKESQETHIMACTPGGVV